MKHKFKNKIKELNLDIQKAIETNTPLITGWKKITRAPKNKNSENRFKILKQKVLKSEWFNKFLNKFNLKYIDSEELGLGIHYKDSDIGMIKNNDSLFKIRINIQTGRSYRWSKYNNWAGSDIDSLLDKEGFPQDLSNLSKIKTFFLTKVSDYIEGKKYYYPPKVKKEITIDQKIKQLKEKIINSDWFKKFILNNDIILSNLYKESNKNFEEVTLSFKLKNRIYNINLQNKKITCTKENSLSFIESPINPKLTLPLKKIKIVNEKEIKNYLTDNFVNFLKYYLK